MQSRIVIPTKITDIELLMKDPTSPIESRKELYQGETIIVSIVIYHDRQILFEEGEIGVIKFSETKPKIVIVTQTNISTGIYLNPEEVNKIDSIILNKEENITTNYDTIGKWNDIMKGNNWRVIVVDKYCSIHLLVFKVSVESEYFNKPVYLRSTFWPLMNIDFYKRYQDTYFTQSFEKNEFLINTLPIKIYQPITIQRKIINNVVCITLTNNLIIPVKVKSFNIYSKIQRGEIPKFPIILNPYESFTIAFPIHLKKEFIEEKVEEGIKSIKAIPPKMLSPSSSLLNMKVPDKPTPQPSKDSKLKRKLIKGLSRKIELDTLQPINLMRQSMSIEDSFLQEEVNNETNTDKETQKINKENLTIELSYKTKLMIGSIYQELSYSIDIIKFHFISIKYNIPKHIYANTSFKIQFDIHYNSYKLRHLLFIINQIDRPDEIDCLHPTLDIGILNKPTLISVSIEFMANKAGVFSLPQVSLKETRTNEVFVVYNLCDVVVENEVKI
ncbi:hypothetical protein EHI8A_233630 [Entamoeba histolytica HM-1:IMSS-B]|uniref:Uncharacterized protein n=4 Tax=Entamoeba histolytica TaxID=5759 RepID=C4M7W5_ENTH1|nr:hypothetical protein EHI_029520 [Entamoeba histolytica HM-1:IMSS]EAL44688.1 hypothetical protein EHI_029520 [Entamoeba histolytica HM-1:IMSS]EMH74729.1 hypothetical protein EHI8A_233630 [Entamoeba histolytica HM-1:IMSS-B]ENY61603.1 hypothetical protein EHI7A_198040 [Entamoeba histolytica HM-1:IMSS-A]GAT97637.1 hypothetical protein CL6EHI_029520 [Entamoeba histolytica]|eukprot:XP_650074.1 hypothetical protein EHI_029520 [Entamoeba histolytica HM-1:IMSS]